MITCCTADPVLGILLFMAILVISIFLICYEEIKTKIFWLTENITRRYLTLFVLAILGIGIAYLFNRWCLFQSLFPANNGENNNLHNSLLGISIGLPVFVGLWLFRTIDTREQIAKTQEQIKKAQEQIDLGLFSDAKKSFFNKENFKERTVGFIQLVRLQRQGMYKEEIKAIFNGGDLITKDNDVANLRNFNLAEVDLSNTGFDLTGANLEGASLKKAKLQGVILKDANLQGAEFDKDTDLQGADLTSADLQKAIGFKLAKNIKTATLESAKLQGLDLRGLDLQGAKLRSVNLQGAEFDKDTDLHGADLTGADLQKTIGFKLAKNIKTTTLESAKLQGLDLRGLDLQGAKLRSVNLQGAEFDKADRSTRCCSCRMLIYKRLLSGLS